MELFAMVHQAEASRRAHVMIKEQGQHQFIADIDLVLLLIPLIQSVITFLANSVEIFPLNQISVLHNVCDHLYSRFNINLTLISECKGIKFFTSSQNKMFHKVCDLYHATLFTFAQ